MSFFQSLMYFFRILDVRHSGHLDAFSLNYFFRDILRQMEKHSQEPVRWVLGQTLLDAIRPHGC